MRATKTTGRQTATVVTRSMRKALSAAVRRTWIVVGAVLIQGTIAPTSAAQSAELAEWKEEAEHGDVDAQVLLGCTYARGDGVAKDSVTAAKWFTQAAQRGHAGAQFLLGNMYALGEGVAESPTKAVKWFTQAAKQGHAEAQFKVAQCYFGGFGVSKDYAEAVNWLTMAGEQGHAEAQFLLAGIYSLGRDGVPANSAKAFEWFTKSAEQGNVTAQRTVGRAYAFGHNVSKNSAKAVEWFAKAAALGDVESKYLLGMMYAQEGITKDLAMAAKWFAEAAQQGHADAQFQLGGLYYTGKGVSKDPVKELEWFTRAAHQGHPVAQFMLACSYATGEGAPKDLVLAYSWANLAAAAGEADAGDLREQVAKKMTPQQIAEAQRLSTSFEPRKEIDERPNASQDAGLIGADRTGSGFFITTDGYFVTNYHVVTDATSVKIGIADKTHVAQVVRVDQANDLALLKANGSFPSLEIVSSASVRVADRIFTVGYPNPGLQGMSPKYSSGEVAAVTGPGDDPRFFQVSAPIQPGNSGGPLLCESGSVVGVIVAQLDKIKTLDITGSLPENVNYAVKGIFLQALIESVPGLASRIRTRPNCGARDSVEAAREVEAATGMVLVGL